MSTSDSVSFSEDHGNNDGVLANPQTERWNRQDRQETITKLAKSRTATGPSVGENRCLSIHFFLTLSSKEFDKTGSSGITFRNLN